jgi:hypothetical protein
MERLNGFIGFLDAPFYHDPVYIVAQFQKETQKLSKKVIQNMFEEIREHRERHHFLAKVRFFKQLPTSLKP